MPSFFGTVPEGAEQKANRQTKNLNKYLYEKKNLYQARRGPFVRALESCEVVEFPPTEEKATNEQSKSRAEFHQAVFLVSPKWTAFSN